MQTSVSHQISPHMHNTWENLSNFVSRGKKHDKVYAQATYLTRCPVLNRKYINRILADNRNREFLQSVFFFFHICIFYVIIIQYFCVFLFDSFHSFCYISSFGLLLRLIFIYAHLLLSLSCLLLRTSHPES